MSIARGVLVASVLVALAGGASAQMSPTVRPDDPVYGFIDRLVAARLIDTVIVGQRPLSQVAIRAILKQARRKVRPSDSWIAAQLTRYESVYPDTLGRLSQRYENEVTALSSAERSIDPDANGAIDVGVNPIVANRLGRPYANGLTDRLAATIEGMPSRWVAGAATERLDLLVPHEGILRTYGRLEQLYARTLWRDVALDAGRQFVFLGQGIDAGLTNSLNSPALDMVRLSTERPFVLPWVFRYMGPMSGVAYFADLGKQQLFPHARLFSYKLSARPVSSFEFGATVADEVGGQGAPGGSFLDKAEDAFPLLDATILHRNFLFSNKFVGMDARLSVPGVRGMQTYMEGVFDDFDLRRVRSVFTEDAGYIWGVSQSCFRECGPLRISAEYHVTGLRYYTHGIFKTGYTVDRQFIGDPLGPRGKGSYVDLDRQGGAYSLRLQGAHEIRSGNQYGAVSTTTNDADFRFVIVNRRPTERRTRFVATLGHSDPFGSTWVAAGVERVEQFAHVEGDNRTNGLLSVGVTVNHLPGSHK